MYDLHVFHKPESYNFLLDSLFNTLQSFYSLWTQNIREVCKKSKWKFKMAFAIRRPTPPPLNGKISRHFFTPLFFFCN